MTANPRINLILLGGPGAGKGTQAERLIEHFELTHVCPGSLLREHVATGTALGQEVKHYLDQGELVPSETIMKLANQKIVDNLATTNGFIFDGTPRHVGQAENLDDLMASHCLEMLEVISLEVPDELMTARIMQRGLTSGRSDDTNLDIIRRRLEIYHADTEPVFQHYQLQNLGQRTDGALEIDLVTRNLIKIIEAKIQT